MTTAYLALGSNLGDRRALIDRALTLLDEGAVRVEETAPVIETDPVGGPPQGMFLNTVCRVGTTLTARELLAHCLAVEIELGRVRAADTPRWGPRPIDIDVLLFGEELIDEEGLVVPHPCMHERRFVLEPLCRIAPDVVHPVLGETMETLLRRLSHGEDETKES